MTIDTEIVPKLYMGTTPSFLKVTNTDGSLGTV